MLRVDVGTAEDPGRDMKKGTLHHHTHALARNALHSDMVMFVTRQTTGQ